MPEFIEIELCDPQMWDGARTVFVNPEYVQNISEFSSKHWGPTTAIHQASPQFAVLFAKGHVAHKFTG
jgi:hypothetical protein